MHTCLSCALLPKIAAVQYLVKVDNVTKCVIINSSVAGLVTGDWSRALTECSIRRGESREGRKKDNLWFWKIVCSREMFGFS